MNFKKTKPTVWLFLLLPAILGGLIAVGIKSQDPWNPTYRLPVSVDLGSVFLFFGLGISVLLIFAWLIQRWLVQKREQIIIQTRENELRSRRRFVRQLDHELKNPLTALHMELAYLMDETPADADARVLTDMAVQLDRLSELVSSLRKLAELEEKGIQPAMVDLPIVLQEVLEAARDHPGYQQRQLLYSPQNAAARLSPVWGDRGLLWIASFNLVDNALKFTPPGAVITINTYEDNSWVVLEVADNGTGISENDLPNIFEELYRGENAHGVKGSGLGLTLVRKVASMHGGSIEAESQPGQGSTFTLKLPAAG